MNSQNYASLEASKRLVEAGIVMETEAVWIDDGYEQCLKHRGSFDEFSFRVIPAPSMAEVWRELPDCVDDADLIMEKTSSGDTYAGYVIPVKASQGEVDSYEQEIYGLLDANPTDALIDLKIWTVEQKRKEQGK